MELKRPPHEPPGVAVFNRLTGQIEQEVVFERWFMDLFYGSPLGLCLTRAALSRRPFSVLFGLLKQLPGSAREIAPFIERHGIPVEELERPPGAYRSFADFFTRRLRPGARPVDPDPGRLISPADGRLLVYRLEGDQVLPVKGRPYRPAELLRDERLAADYRDGDCLVLRLAPADYHRFCYLDGGRHGPVRPVSGRLHSVHPLALATGLAILTENQRRVTVLQTEGFGPVVQVDVGAMIAGRMVHHQPRGGPCERGQEMGYFQLGGSTIVLLLQAGRAQIDEEIVHHSRRGIESLVRYGAGIGRAR